TENASLTLKGTDPTTLAKWANSYVDLADSAARQELTDTLTDEVKVRKRSLREQVDTLRNVAEKERQNRITRLKEALGIAERIGLDDPADSGIPLILINTQRRSEGQSADSLIYLRGAKAIRAELEQLNLRTSDDAYIPELSDLLKRMALLKSIDLSPELLSVTTIDRAAIVPEDPVKPRRGLIITLGFVLGLTLAPLFVLARLLVVSYRV